jgi:SAM-dependent methyltransferase
MHDFAALFRTRFIRELWRRLGRDFGGRPIAIYGGGRHTSWLLDTIADVEGGPRIGCILDDAGGGRSMTGIQVATPSDCDPAMFAAVIVSSDSAESQLAAKARTWANTGPADRQPAVIEPYRGLPPGPYPTAGTSTGSLSDDRMLPGGLDNDAIALAKALGAQYPVPASSNRAGYSPETDADYITTGKAERETIGKICASHGVELEAARDILDWGCSTGRVLRHFDDLSDQTKLWGCDIEEKSIDWAQRHFDGRFRFFSTTLEPSLPVPDNSFDFIYGISIFTHISNNIDTWLMEFRRVLRPGGAALVTVHDEHSWDFCRDNPQAFISRHCPRYDFTKPLEADFLAHGQGPSCQTFWHSRGIRRRWSHALEVAGIEPLKFCSGTQAGVLLRQRV